MHVSTKRSAVMGTNTALILTLTQAQCDEAVWGVEVKHYIRSESVANLKLRPLRSRKRCPSQVFGMLCVIRNNLNLHFPEIESQHPTSFISLFTNNRNTATVRSSIHNLKVRHLHYKVIRNPIRRSCSQESCSIGQHCCLIFTGYEW
jgi:hypothetical protein